ncbi:MAG: hypothetical protein OIF40_16675 [Mangrovicoccus sp.]|nr:hypothetical protein [Mangrovicoccus sp.]
MQALTGCTARKLDILYLAGSRGGGMHEMMQQNAKGWVVQILTLLAPALASGVLALFS